MATRPTTWRHLGVSPGGGLVLVRGYCEAANPETGRWLCLNDRPGRKRGRFCTGHQQQVSSGRNLAPLKPCHRIRRRDVCLTAEERAEFRHLARLGWKGADLAARFNIALSTAYTYAWRVRRGTL